MDKCLAVSLLVVTVIASVSVGADDLCPPWFIPGLNSSCPADQQFCFCTCSSVAPFIMNCDNHQYTSYLLRGYCAFWSNDTGHTLVSSCPYIFPNNLFHDNSLQLPQNVENLNSFLCQLLSREEGSIVCGQCTNGTGPAVNSVGSQCVKCNQVNVLYFILLHILPPTVIFIFIFLIQVDVHSSPMAFYILYCNALSIFLQSQSGMPLYLSFSKTIFMRLILTFNSIWSFDIFYFISPPLCLSSHLEGVFIPYIQILFGLYPFMLILIAFFGIECYARNFMPVVMLWKPIHKALSCIRKSWNPHLLLVQAFATVFFMSYTKLILLVTSSFSQMNLMDEHGQVESIRIFIDPRVKFGSQQHVIQIAFFLSFLLLFLLPPLILLLIYPTRLYIKVQKYLPPRTNLAIKTFVSAFQGSYKDGSSGTRDYRIFPAVLLIGCLFICFWFYIVGFFTEVARKPIIHWQFGIVLLTILTVVIAVTRPHKSDKVNNTGICLTALLTIASAIYLFNDTYPSSHSPAIDNVVITLLSIPHLVFFIFLLYHFRCKLCRYVLKKFCRNGPVELEHQPLLIN